ncbi:MAG: hypothetical protein Q8N99_06550, partial [Nanoarchaeota archaeon]|nr:hypothetical protein [Nanoarchaeota archaeon]
NHIIYDVVIFGGFDFGSSKKFPNQKNRRSNSILQDGVGDFSGNFFDIGYASFFRDISFYIFFISFHKNSKYFLFIDLFIIFHKF